MTNRFVTIITQTIFEIGNQIVTNITLLGLLDGPPWNTLTFDTGTVVQAILN